ncbi:MAG TPA: MFS transporter [Candidatus Limnocylindrales bacterium]|nr:MFS transporter [Candidatus Limnocylindrales bacterium]
MITKGGREVKRTCFTFEGLSSFATSLNSYYLYFYMRDQFGFGNKENLAFAALNGLIYTISAWQAGKFAQRHGYFTALKIGFGVMILALAAGSQSHHAAGVIVATGLFNVGMCFLWPTIEALVSEGGNAVTLPRAVGTYNLVWASTNALALFSGGTLVEAFGFKTIFYLPLALCIGQLAATLWLEKQVNGERSMGSAPAPVIPPDPHRPSPVRTRAFLRMAWLANPVAYIAIYTFIPELPGVAANFHLTPMFAGFACSLWGFVRFGTFLTLWLWTGWHYRFRWLVAAFALLIVSFVSILTVPSLPVLIVAQIFFGGAIGLIYYSSLFYSMDAGDTKGEHGGIHEAAIGIGNCIGPATGALTLQFLPGLAHGSAFAVSGLLLCGFGALLGIWKTAR